MSYEELEQRVDSIKDELEHLSQVVKAEFAQLRKQVNGQTTLKATSEGETQLREEDLIPGAEYDLVTHLPPRHVRKLRGRIVSVTCTPPELGLSEVEWESARAMMEVMDERNELV